MRKLPYRARTSTGDTFDIEFPLHNETVSPVRVAQLVSAILAAVDKDITVAGEASNGDVLQAVAMAMAIRARMIHAPPATVEQLAEQLLRIAMAAAADAPREGEQAGHA